jgi:hypothetical protein
MKLKIRKTKVIVVTIYRSQVVLKTLPYTRRYLSKLKTKVQQALQAGTSRQYCNTGPTRDRDGASPQHSVIFQNRFNILVLRCRAFKLIRTYLLYSTNF